MKPINLRYDIFTTIEFDEITSRFWFCRKGKQIRCIDDNTLEYWLIRQIMLMRQHGVGVSYADESQLVPPQIKSKE